MDAMVPRFAGRFGMLSHGGRGMAGVFVPWLESQIFGVLEKWRVLIHVRKETP
jgi:hypothetical protein